VNVFLDLQPGHKEKLWSHLLQNDTEQVAIVFAAVEIRHDATLFIAREAYLATDEDFEIHSEFHVELTDEARARIIKQAWDTGTTPVEFHSHPGDCWGAEFSPSDLYGFSEYVPHCRWRLRGRPYLAVVVSPAGMDALAWTGTGDKPLCLNAIRPASGTPIVPTNQTIQKLTLEVPGHGPGAF
jgi:hypothetical protein